MADVTNKDVDNIIALLDGMVESGTSRIKVETSDEIEAEQVKKRSHLGRCDVGSVFASKDFKNVGCD